MSIKDWCAEWIDEYTIRLIPPKSIDAPWRVNWSNPSDGFNYVVWELAKALAGERNEHQN
jgi:hypothetical protein